MKFSFLIYMIFAILNLAIISDAHARKETYTFGSKKGQNIEDQLDIEERLNNNIVDAVKALETSIKANSAAIEKLVTQQKSSTDRLAKALSIIAKLIDKNDKKQIALLKEIAGGDPAMDNPQNEPNFDPDNY